MVVFMAPWCNKCQKFMPEYGKAAEVLQSETPPMTLAEVRLIPYDKKKCF